jgi:predicted XRE-type DNA-binding protein
VTGESPKLRRFASGWDAIEDTAEQAENMRLRSELMIAIRQVVEGWGVVQAEAAKRLGLTQPRLNDLLRGRIGKFSLDALVGIAGRGGIGVRMRVLLPAAPKRRRATPASPRKAA